MHRLLGALAIVILSLGWHVAEGFMLIDPMSAPTMKVTTSRLHNTLLHSINPNSSSASSGEQDSDSQHEPLDKINNNTNATIIDDFQFNLAASSPSSFLETSDDDLSWRVAKLRLEEQHTARLLKSRPRFLPYRECRKWVQAWSRWNSEDDWMAWIDTGEKRNAYIPSRPDAYYQSTGDWKGWAHFLGVDEDRKSDTFQ
jgi:hypothetical protein